MSFAIHYLITEPSPRRPTKQDLEQAKAREQELTVRIQHLEAEAKKNMVAREKATSSLASLTTEFRAVAERSKNRGAMLAKLIGAVREVEEIKGRLEVCYFYINNMGMHCSFSTCACSLFHSTLLLFVQKPWLLTFCFFL